MRGQRLISIGVYAQYAAASPRHRERNGSEHWLPPYQQEAIWGSEGGSVYEVLPNAHMHTVRAMGKACPQEAEVAMRTAPPGCRPAPVLHAFMQAYALLAR